MSKILKRPMFRKGGPTNEGIVSMVQPRQNYQGGSYEELIKQYPERAQVIKESMSNAALLEALSGAGRSKQDRVSDLLIRGGLNLMSQRPRGSIFSTAAEAYKEPTSKFLSESEKEEAYKRQLRLTGATQAMSAEQARIKAAQNQTSPYLKGKSPTDQISYDTYKIADRYKDDLNIAQANNIAKLKFIKDRGLLTEQKELKNYVDALDPSVEFIDVNNFEQTKEGFFVPPAPRGKLKSQYKSGRTYFDPNTNVIYKYEGGALKPVTPSLTGLFNRIR
jgi:hypothetical protein